MEDSQQFWSFKKKGQKLSKLEIEQKNDLKKHPTNEKCIKNYQHKECNTTSK